MKRILFYIITLLSLGITTNGQSLAKTKLPHESGTIPLTVRDYEDLVKYYRYYKQDSAEYLADKGLALARRNGDSVGVAAMLVQMGMIDDNLGEFELARDKYNAAISLFKSAGDKKGIASATIRKGVVELRNGKYDNAIQYFFDALRISESAHDSFGMMEGYYSLSWAWLDQKKFDSALHYLLVADNINKQLPFSNISLNILNHLGVVYRETGQLKKARLVLEEGVEKSLAPEYQGLNITMTNNLAGVYGKLGMKRRAIEIQLEALERARKIENYLRESQTLFGLFKSYGTDNPEKAIFYLQASIELARSKRLPKHEMRYLKSGAELYKSLGNFAAALEMKEREHFLSDSFLSKTTLQNIESLRSEYELARSRARVTELDLENKRRQLELRNTAIIRNVTLAGFTILLVFLALLYNQYRIKQKNSRLVTAKNLTLERLLDEKEWLLKEVHHRVKNNLHTIMSLLETQSAYVKDDALAVLQTSQHRVYAMSLIHQKLYQFDKSTTIDMSLYLPELITYLADSYGTGSRIVFHKHIEPVRLDISQAIPVGLIFNEIVTNSIKYAFPDRSGEITIKLTKPETHVIQLTVADNGIGLPADSVRKSPASLGMKLIRGLSDDLKAILDINGERGTTFRLTFEEAMLPVKS